MMDFYRAKEKITLETTNKLMMDITQIILRDMKRRSQRSIIMKKQRNIVCSILMRIIRKDMGLRKIIVKSQVLNSQISTQTTLIQEVQQERTSSSLQAKKTFQT